MAAEFEEQKQLDRAAGAFRNALELAPGNAVVHLYLGYVYERMGLRGQAAQVYSLADDIDQRIMTAWQNAKADPDVRIRSQKADICLRQHYAELHRASVDHIADLHKSAKLDRIYGAIWCQTHPGNFSYKTDMQAPHVFYVPGLPPRPYLHSSDRKWLRELSAASSKIRDEVTAYQIAEAEDAVPYVDKSLRLPGEGWDVLQGSLNWSSLHLFKNGMRNRDLEKAFPETVAAIERAPYVALKGEPLEAFFSVLKPHMHIPPHFGLANSALTVHLPLIVPGEASLRVGDHHHSWTEGEAFAFDDSFEHESWNKSEETRINLIFEAWHPDLKKIEKEAIDFTFAARRDWLAQRNLGYSDSS